MHRLAELAIAVVAGVSAIGVTLGAFFIAEAVSDVVCIICEVLA